MFKFLKDRKKKDNKGFTLVELVIVIAILAILVGLLAPQYTKYVEKSRKSADISNLDNLVEGLKVAASDHEYNLGTGSTGKVVYTIAISDKGTILKKGSDEVATTDDASKALKEYSGYEFPTNDAKIVLKSSKWGKGTTVYNTDATSEIYATLTIDNVTDSVTVDYSSNVTSYSKTGIIS